MRRVLVLLCAAALAAVTAPTAGATADPEVWPPPAPFGRPYAVRDLALPAGATSSKAVAVNAAGLIAGEVTVGGARHAAVWDAAGRVRDLGAPTGGQAWAVDVADNGWVAGTAREASGTRWPWVWTGRGGLRRLDGIPDRTTEAVAMNRSGQVLLRVESLQPVDQWGNFAAYPSIWTPGLQGRALPSRGSWYDRPMAINDRGESVGTSAVDGGYPDALVVWDAEGYLTDVTGRSGLVDVLAVETADLDEAGTVAGLVYGYGPAGEGEYTLAWRARYGLLDGSLGLDGTNGDASMAMNERGQVVAKARRSCEGHEDFCGDQATLWTIGQAPDYLPVGARYSNSRDVNDLGEVAGTDGVAPRWVFDGRLIHVLPGAGDGAPGVTAMNDAGLVIGTIADGGRRRAAAWVAPRGSVTVSVPAAADTYVHPSLPSTSFGSDAALAGGGVDEYLGLLRFAVPTAPAGRTLVAARLHLHTGPQTFAGSREAHVLRLVTGAWSEATTWTTRPSLGAELSHSVIGATGRDTSVAAYVDTRQVPAGGTLDLAVSGGRDSLWLATREAAPNLRPSLELIYR